MDNGYVYLAATRLTVFRNDDDWAMTIEVFGFSPRAGIPDTHIYTFASKIVNRKGAEKFAKRGDYENYLALNPNNESHFIYPIEDGDWLDEENVWSDAIEIKLRGKSIALPNLNRIEREGIEVINMDEVRVFELCRFLASVHREEVLATAEELRTNVGKDLKQVLQLNEWNHPDIIGDCLPSGSETFQQLAEVIVSGDVGKYRPTLTPNTHWSNWPEGGTL